MLPITWRQTISVLKSKAAKLFTASIPNFKHGHEGSENTFAEVYLQPTAVEEMTADWQYKSENSPSSPEEEYTGQEFYRSEIACTNKILIRVCRIFADFGEYCIVLEEEVLYVLWTYM